MYGLAVAPLNSSYLAPMTSFEQYGRFLPISWHATDSSAVCDMPSTGTLLHPDLLYFRALGITPAGECTTNSATHDGLRARRKGAEDDGRGRDWEKEAS